MTTESKGCDCKRATCALLHRCVKCERLAIGTVPVLSWPGTRMFFGIPKRPPPQPVAVEARLCHGCGSGICNGPDDVVEVRIRKILRMLEKGTPIRAALKWAHGDGDRGIPTGYADLPERPPTEPTFPKTR